MAEGPKRDTLSGPVLRMAKFFLGETLPVVSGAPDIYRLAGDLKARGVPVRASEEELLTKILWCLLQIQNDKEETEQHTALALLAAVVLAIIEDDDFFIPDGVDTTSRYELELLAISVMREHYQASMSLGASIGIYDLSIKHSGDLDGVRERLPGADQPELDNVITKLKIHLGQGEEIFEQQTDPEREAKHRARLDMAYTRSSYLLARLVSIGPASDHEVVRAHIIRREHKHVEIDALGAHRINEEQQAKAAKHFLAWTEENLGEELTDANKAELANRLKDMAKEKADPSASGSNWFFDME
jgi:hypothetical protein